jgi:hypothetical protein
MGTLFRIRCEECDSKENVTFDGFVGAVLRDRGAPGVILPDGYLVYRDPKGEVRILPHPIETSALEAAGGSWTSATLDGRILRFTNLICTQCGTLNKTASISDGSLGCSTGLVAAAVVIAVNFYFDNHWWLELTFVWLALIIPQLACGVYVRWRHADKAAKYQFSQCVNCGSEDATTLIDATHEKLPCPKCGRHSVTISIAGKS